ncbi:MAG TPA: D-Ala-D-Ala carboxypeptidase family metallohydrolase [Chlamydiales bacterium]|nr:D-Ala-D-Ala carboxypeptidase family metallohydrolase [Chlamydiales bacterium]
MFSDMRNRIGTLKRNILILLKIAIFSSCSGLERSEREKIRKRNCKGESIYRNQSDRFFAIETPKHTQRALYPWESESNLPRITKDFFRCKGNPTHDPIATLGDPILDCDGGNRHGLPIIQGQEGVYPILISQLNYIQKKTGKRVIITSGHRCPSHNTYVDPSPENRTSKHQIGAEVDFYVQGMEDRPEEIIALLMHYYQETPAYQNKQEFLIFTRYDKSDARVDIQPWMNKEIYIKLNQKNEGRNLDNRHPHPYISIQVRFDTKKNEKVVYDWQKANKGYSRGW